MKSVVNYFGNKSFIKSIIFLFLFTSILFVKKVPGKTQKTKKYNLEKITIHKKLDLQKGVNLSDLYWEKFYIQDGKNNSAWEKLEMDDFEKLKNKINSLNKKKLNILHRSIVINNKVGPDISWLIPPGFSWNPIYKFDLNVRGHNSEIPNPKKRNFFGWNNGDAVGLFSYQFLHLDKASLGVNFGVRSLYQGDSALGGQSKFGEGISGGFRYDYELSENSGFAFGAEQLIHFDSLTDTGRNIYLTASKGWWSSQKEDFPLYIATAGVGTGRMAVGTVKGLCSDILDGAGTEIRTRRNLCWAPVFSLASVWNQKFSSFFEYNSRFFLLGSSLAPLEDIPIRGTVALMLSDHIDNYKLNDFGEMNWVFNISFGF